MMKSLVIPNLRLIQILVINLKTLFILSFLPSTATAIFNVTCESAFSTISYSPNKTSYEHKVIEQANQFVQLLITTQSKALSQSQRQARLADAQRVFSELTEAHPEIADLIQEEWRKLHSGSESATESRRTKLVSDIQTLEQQLLTLTLTLQSQQIGEWEIVKDSSTDPKVKADLKTHLLKESLNRKHRLKIPSVHLRTKRPRSPSLISVSQNGVLIEFDPQGTNGHSNFVRGAIAHPDGRIISWSDDHTLIVWKLVDETYVVDQRLGRNENRDPKWGHIGLLTGAKVLSDGSILSSSADSTLILWKPVDGTYIFDQRLGDVSIRDPDKLVAKFKIGFQVLPDGRILRWSHREHSLILWKPVDGTYVIDQRLGGDPDNFDPKKGHTVWVYGAQVLSDGKIISWSEDRTLIIWSPIKGKYTLTERLGQIHNSEPQKGHTKRVIDAKVLHDGRVVSSDDDDRFLLWQFTHSKAIQNEKETLSKELNSLKTALTGLEAQRSSIEDISEVGGL